MIIFIKTLSGKTLTIDVEQTDNVALLKQKILEREKVPIDTQRILYAGKELNDSATIEECGIKKESILHLVLKKAENNMQKLTTMEQSELRVAQSAQASKYYNASVGLNDELTTYQDSESKFDTHANPQGQDYDLGKDGEFGDFVVVIGIFYQFSLDNVVSALKRKGFAVLVYKKEDEFLEALKQADIAFFISGMSATFNSHVFGKAVAEFHRNGGALYVWADNVPLYLHANAVLPFVLKEDIKLIGNTPGDKVLKLGEPTDRGCFGPHIITTGVINLYEGVTICYPEKLGPLKVLCTSTDNFPAVCFADNEALGDKTCGRIVVDCGFTKLYYKWEDAGTARYILNACIWLLGIEHKMLHEIPITGKNIDRKIEDNFVPKIPPSIDNNNDLNNNNSSSSSNSNTSNNSSSNSSSSKGFSFSKLFSRKKK